MRLIIFLMFISGSSSWAVGDEEASAKKAEILDATYSRMKTFYNAKKELIEKLCTITPLDTGALPDNNPYEACKRKAEVKIANLLKKQSYLYGWKSHNNPQSDIALAEGVDLRGYGEGFCMSAKRFNFGEYGLGFLGSIPEQVQYGNWQCQRQRGWGEEEVCCSKIS